jgi:hypothetical protein
MGWNAHQLSELHFSGHVLWSYGGLCHACLASVLLRVIGQSQGKNGRDAQTMGASILLGGIFTFLGTVPLAFRSSEIFTTIYIAFMGLTRHAGLRPRSYPLTSDPFHHSRHWRRTLRAGRLVPQWWWKRQRPRRRPFPKQWQLAAIRKCPKWKWKQQ